MLTILVRTIIIYVILIATMRLMGKRQLGELEISELVTTLLISEIASLPIADQTIPVIYAIIPLVTILTLEMVLSLILLKCPRLKNLASARPTVLIRHGVLDQRELKRSRISLDELISELRQAGVSTIEAVDYAILEQNGKISIILKKAGSPPSAADLNIILKENGIMHAVIEDGHINDYNLALLGHDRSWLSDILKEKQRQAERVFLLCLDDAGNFYMIDKEETE